jgi:drug/metabolite transporter (DMT)-like permease
LRHRFQSTTECISVSQPSSPFPQGTVSTSAIVAASGAFWGLWWIPLRFLESRGLTGNWANVTLNAAATLIVLPIVIAKPWPTRQDLGRLLVVGLLAGFTFATWNHALLYGTVVRVTLLFYLSPIWATAFGVLFLRDPVGPARVVSILLGFSGASMVLDFHGIVPVPRNGAEWLALASGVTFALMTVYIRKTHDVGALQKTLANSMFAIPFALAFLIIVPAPPPSFGTLISALPLILVSCIWLVPVGFLILWGAGRLDPGRVSILLLFEVLASALSAALFANEPFGWHEGIGCVLILGAGLIEGINQLCARPRPDVIP